VVVHRCVRGIFNGALPKEDQKKEGGSATTMEKGERDTYVSNLIAHQPEPARKRSGSRDRY